MNHSQRLVSIGMPVFNGEDFLRLSIEALLNQDYRNIELIISDDASTDNTAAICREYQARDHRVRYYHNEERSGLTTNFNRVLEMAAGEYFMWAAHDDLWEPSYISKCAAVLNDQPGVVLCAAVAKQIRRDGRTNKEELREDVGTVGLKKMERLRKVIKATLWNTPLYGLMRAGVAKKLVLHNYVGSDHMLMAELSLQGEFVYLPERLFISRIGGAGNSAEGIVKAQKIKWLGARYFHNSTFFFSFLLDSIQWSPLTPLEHIKAWVYIIDKFTHRPFSGFIYAEMIKLVPSPLISLVRKIKRTLHKDQVP